MSYLTAEQILAAEDLQTEDVDIPAWGGKVRVRTISAQEAQDANDRAEKFGHPMAIEVAALAVVDGEGKPIFSIEQAKQLLGKSNHAFTTMVKAVLRLNGLGEEAEKELAKNCETPADGASTSS
jgi:hypothetical protein